MGFPIWSIPFHLKVNTPDFLPKEFGIVDIMGHYFGHDQRPRSFWMIARAKHEHVKRTIARSMRHKVMEGIYKKVTDQGQKSPKEFRDQKSVHVGMTHAELLAEFEHKSARWTE